MTFNAFNPQENARALKFYVPAHDNYQDFTTIMHAAQNGYWHHSSLEVNLQLIELRFHKANELKKSFEHYILE